MQDAIDDEDDLVDLWSTADLKTRSHRQRARQVMRVPPHGWCARRIQFSTPDPCMTLVDVQGTLDSLRATVNRLVTKHCDETLAR